MNQVLLQELKRLRNEIAHGQRHIDSESLGKRLQELGISIPPEDLQWFVADLLRGFSDIGEYFVPPALLSVVRSLLEGRSAKVACDPWAGYGILAATVQEAVQARKTYACTRNEQVVALARILAPQLDWRTGDPLAFLETIAEPFDVVASILPFGMRASRVVELHGVSGEPLRSSGDLSQILLAAASLRLSPEGLGLFVVTPSFFLMEKSVLYDLPRLGLCVEAALALPAGSFAPFTNIAPYLIIVRKQTLTHMFVAQLAQDAHTNRQIVTNLRDGRAAGPLELGRFVNPVLFRGLDSLRLREKLHDAARRYRIHPARLGDLAQEIRLGRPSDDFAFPIAINSLYIPLVGLSDVVNSTEAMTLKRQNYAQVVINPAISDARFVALFLNSELGRAIREANKSGATIPKLNRLGLEELKIFVPRLEIQSKTLDVAARIAGEQNTLFGLQNDLSALNRELWNNPWQVEDLDSRLRTFSARLTAGATPHVAITLDQWFETLPFPLASILRAWQATPSQDYKTKHEHLLHFFEAVAEFLSVIYLSAFSSQKEIFADHKHRLAEAWKEQHLTLQRATFGTWKVIVEYFSKQTRNLLSGDAEKRAQCAELFSDPIYVLPEILSQKELAAILSTVNKMRNDWTGHGGVVSQAEAQLRNERLLTELQRLREAMSDGWQQVQLIRALHCLPRHGVFDNEVAILVGSNSEFLKESRSMSSWLDVERLYLASHGSGRALLLLPLLQVGPSPLSAKNACYFFNRIDKDGIRFISYHFVDQPELKDLSSDTLAAINSLTEVDSNNDH